MLRIVSRNLSWHLCGRTRWFSRAIKAEDLPKPPPGHPPEIFEWDYILKGAETDEERSEIIKLKALYQNTIQFLREDYKTTVDWTEFEGKVPEKILAKYKKAYDDAAKEAKKGSFSTPFDQKEWDTKTKEMLATIKELELETKEKLAELDADIAKTEARLARLSTTTIDEEMALDPELAKRVDEAVSKELEYEP
eukprot:g8879.t1